MTEVPDFANIRVDESGTHTAYTQAQSTLRDHRENILDHDPTGIEDPAISRALHGHNETTRSHIDAADEDLDKGKRAVNALGESDRNSAARTRGIGPGGIAALRDALSQPQGAANPFAQAPAPAPMMPAPAMPAPQMPMPTSTPMVNLAPAALARLIAGANQHSSGAPGAQGGGKAPLPPSGTALQPTGAGTLSKSQLLAVIDKSLDNNGISTNPEVRAIWREIQYNQIMHESSGRADAVNRIDDNAVGAIQSDGAPAQSSRGLAQVIPETFARYHVAGTSNNIYDPVANVSASISYMMAKYHVSADGNGLHALHSERMAAGYGGY